MLGALQADWDFSLISRRAEALYGPLGDGKQRIDAWQHLLATQQQTPELEQLKVVNLFFNKQMRYVEDIDAGVVGAVLHGYVLRSPHAHALIRSLDRPALHAFATEIARECARVGTVLDNRLSPAAANAA